MRLLPFLLLLHTSAGTPLTQGTSEPTPHIFNAANTSAISLVRNKRGCVGRTRIKLLYCEPGRLRYTYFLNEIKVQIDQACSVRPRIKWVLNKIGNSRPYDTSFHADKLVFTLGPSDNLKDGNYRLKVVVTEPGQKPVAKTCEFEMLSEPPIILFTNGRVHYLRSGEVYFVSIRNSVSKIPLKREDVSWRIKCQLREELQPVPACKLAKCPVWKKGLSHHLKAQECYYSIEFRASVKFHHLEVYSSQTVLYITDFERKYMLTCLRNCDVSQNKFTNPKLETVVKVECLSRCWQFDQINSTLEVKDTETNEIIPSSKYSRTGDLITINPDVFQHDHSYSVSAKGEDFKAVTFLRTSPEIVYPKCEINPKKGMSLITVFKVVCNTDDKYTTFYPSNYKVYQKLPNGESVMIASSNYGRFDFVLGSTGGATETLTISGNNMFYNNYKNELGVVTLKSPVVSDARMDMLLGRVNELSSQGDYARAVQIARGILHESSKENSKIETGPVFKELILSLNKIAVESIYSYNRIGSLLDSFYKKIQPEFKEELSDLCKKLSETELHVLKKSLYNVQMDDEAKALMLPMKKCANAILDDDIIEMDDINVTTPSEVVDDPATIEDYPNYDQAFYSQEDEAIKNNAINTIMNSGQVTALTLNPGDEVVEKYNNTESKISKEYGKDIHKKIINVSGAEISMSLPSNKLTNEKISTIVTSYNRTLFKTKLDTKVVDVGIFVLRNSTKKTADVKVKIKFDVNTEPFSKVKYTVTAPGRRSSWKEPEIEYAMNVHRLNLNKKQICNVHFGKLETGKKLQFVFTNDRRPRLWDFTEKKIKVLDPNVESSHVVSCPYKQLSYDSFIYVAVLPHDDLAQNSSGNVSVDYEVAFASQYCVVYLTGEKSWKHAECNVSFIADVDDETIICDCNHTTLFAAMNKKVKNKLDVVKKIEFVTRKFINYVVFVHVAVVFACYCIALIFALKRNSKKLGREKVIFLSDNLKNDRYGYLIVIKTGDMPQAGTTSNVMLQVYGQKNNSKPHVLNYPDPDKKLLQRNTVDWFVLTNGVYLGDILYIQLWFDGIGYRPTWFCEHIYFIDLQTRKEWYFNVQKLFTLKNDVSVEFKVEPTNTYEISESILTTLIKHAKFHVGGEITWNIFTTSHDENFTYSQRLTVILSMIYTTYILIILFMYPPRMRISDAYGYGYFDYHHDLLLICPISSIISCLINLPFVYFFRNSENEENAVSFYKEKKPYPICTMRVTWIVLVVWIILCMCYLVIFGFSVTFHTSYLWICATVVSILIAIFVVENIYTTVFNIIYARFAKLNAKQYNFVGILTEIENQRKILFSIFGEMLLRPYFIEHYKHLTRDKILEMMNVEIRRVEVAKTFRDFMLFLIYLFLLYAMCFSNVDRLDYRSNLAMKQMLTGKFFTKNLAINNTFENERDIYNYINYTIIPIIHATNWYGNYNTIDAGLMLDFKTKILGVVQLRQQRREQNCNPTPPMNALKMKCSNFSRLFKNWPYYDGSQTAHTLGALETYNGEGYIANLGRSLYNSYFVINLLSKIKWIDINTKVLFIDFWTYNPNYNIFNLVKVMFERSESGRIIKSETVFTTRLLYATPLNEAVVITLIVIFIIVIIYNTVTNLIRVPKRTKYFFKDMWEVLDVMLLLLSIAICALYFYRQYLVKKLMYTLVNSDNNQFVYYFELITVAKGNTFIGFALLCIATIRLWKYLRFAIAFRAMERTLWKSSGALFIAFMYQVFIYFMFSIYLNIVYGQTFTPFQTFGRTMITLIQISINLIKNLDHIFLSQYGNEYYVFYSFFILTSKVFITIYSTIIIMGFKESQSYFSNKPMYYTIKHYCIDQSTYYSELIKRQGNSGRLRGGEDKGEEEPDVVYPKEKSKRYADCLTMSNDKMRLMRFIALAVIRKRASLDLRRGVGRRSISEEQYALMARITLCLINPDKKTQGKYNKRSTIDHLFFHGRDPEDNSVRFVSDDTILRMEYAAKYILQPKQPDIVFDDNRYVIHVDGDYKRLEYYRDTINLINKTIDNIRIIDKRKPRVEDEIEKTEFVGNLEGARKAKGGKLGSRKGSKKGKVGSEEKGKKRGKSGEREKVQKKKKQKKSDNE